MKQNYYNHIALFFFILLFLPLSDASASENKADNFEYIDCDKIQRIENTRLFFMRSSQGFPYNRHSVSPLMEKIPEEMSSVYSRLPGQKAVMQTIAIQIIPTKHLKRKTIEGMHLWGVDSDINIVVDNSLNEDLNFHLDKHAPIKILAISQMSIRFKEGLRYIKILKISNNEVLESFTLNANKFRDNAGKSIEGYYT